MSNVMMSGLLLNLKDIFFDRRSFWMAHSLCAGSKTGAEVRPQVRAAFIQVIKKSVNRHDR